MKLNFLFLNIFLGSLSSSQNAAKPIKNDLMALEILKSSIYEAAIASKNSVAIDAHSFLTYNLIFTNIHIKNNETRERLVVTLHALFDVFDNTGFVMHSKYTELEKDECPFTDDLCNLHILLLNLIKGD